MSLAGRGTCRYGLLRSRTESPGGRRAWTRGIARRLFRAADGPHPPSRDHQRLPLGPHREQPHSLADGGRPQPQHDRLGRPHLRRLRVQLSLGPAHRSCPAAVAFAATRPAACLDSRPSGRSAGVSRHVERVGPFRKPRFRHCRRPRHRRCLRDSGHRHRRAPNRADREDGGRGDGRRCCRCCRRLVERLQARRHRRSGNGRGVPERRHRELLAGDVSRAGHRSRPLQRRPPVRPRGRLDGAYRRPGRG